MLARGRQFLSRSAQLVSKNRLPIVGASSVSVIGGYFASTRHFANCEAKPADVDAETPKKTGLASKDGWKTTPSGLKYWDVQEGTGESPSSGQIVFVHYTGKLKDGSTFDSSIPRGTPLEFKVGTGQVIKGWDEGILSMKVGGRRNLIIPPMLGYGFKSVGPIPGNSEFDKI